jgi:hypothetical protein
VSWIESHTVLIRHRKVIELARELRIRKAHVIGHLHALWHAALEQSEDGDLSQWSDGLIAELSDYPGDAPQYVRLLQKYGFLDGRILHDWLDYAGRYLEAKYRTANPEKLRKIHLKHPKGGLKTDFSQTKVSPPNQPDLTIPTKPNKQQKTVAHTAAPIAVAADLPLKPTEQPGQAIAVADEQKAVAMPTPRVLAPNQMLVECIKLAYEKNTGYSYHATAKSYILAAKLVKECGYEQCLDKCRILYRMCQSKAQFFTRNGFADFSIETLSTHWPKILPDGVMSKSESELDAMMKYMQPDKVSEVQPC